MICGIGIDVVDVRRMRRARLRFGRRLVERLLHPEEWADYECQRHHPEAFLARRWAAKEALVKALGTGLVRGLMPRQLCVTHDPQGRPRIVCSETVAAHLRRLGAEHCHLSISDERHYAAACVVLEGNPSQ